jgi:hypothetical protein
VEKGLQEEQQQPTRAAANNNKQQQQEHSQCKAACLHRDFFKRDLLHRKFSEIHKVTKLFL